MHNKYVFISIWFNGPLQKQTNFLRCKRKNCARQKQLNDTKSWNQLKMRLYLNHFNVSKLMFGRMLRKLFFIFVSFSCVIVKFVCNFWHTFLQIYGSGKNWICAFGTVLEKSAFCVRQICSFCVLQQHLRSPKHKTNILIYYLSIVMFNNEI